MRKRVKSEPVYHFRHVVGPGVDGAVIMDSSTGFVDEELRRRVVQRGVDVRALVLVERQPHPNPLLDPEREPEVDLAGRLEAA